MMDDHQAIELPPLSMYRQKKAIEAYEEAQQIMNPESVQIANTIIGYLQSSEFFGVLVLIMMYRLGILFFRKLPTIVQELRKLK